jgi:hypothetical protein
MSQEHIREAARATRNEALKRHRKEVQRWKVLFLWCFAGYWVLLGALAYLHFRPKPEPSTWRTDKPPCLEPVHVVTKAFMDRKGRIRSYDNGEVIEITHWTTK